MAMKKGILMVDDLSPRKIPLFLSDENKKKYFFVDSFILNGVNVEADNKRVFNYFMNNRSLVVVTTTIITDITHVGAGC
ncbi:thr operon leader peptide [Vibrio sp. 1-1(7)]|nr:thr operon leader peptide [Vibrio sp. 1-1(7)]NNN72948.1 thr operon leader peptide [Vibrio sp. 12-2(3-a)]